MIANNPAVDGGGAAAVRHITLVVVLVGLPLTVCAQDARLPLPDPATVRKLTFDAPSESHSSRSGAEIRSVVAFLMAHDSNWERETETHYPQFTISFDVGKEKPFVIQAGSMGEAAYLRTAEFGDGNKIRQIAVADLCSLVELCGHDASIALLRPTAGPYKTRIERVLSQCTTISARDLDKRGARRLLEGVLNYARSNPKDMQTYEVLTWLDFFAVSDLAQGWYVVRLAGRGGHCFANLLADKDGRVMPATPENCLQACRSDFLGETEDTDAVKTLCAKVLEGSSHGVIVNRNEDIPEYEKKPLPEEQSRLIKPMVKQRLDGKSVYTFFSYQGVGGVVWQCALTIEDRTRCLSWSMKEVARHIGDARYIM